MLPKAITLNSLEGKMPFIEMGYDQIREIKLNKGLESPFLLLSRSVIHQNLNRLSSALPGVGIHYAIKPNSHPVILEEVARAGHTFDIASIHEMQLAVEAGGHIRDFVHSHPIKSPYELSEAMKAGVELFVADNLAEIEKFRDYSRKVKIMVRVKIEDSSAMVNLSYKFGCMPYEVLPLARRIIECGHEFGGLAFHVGSQCLDNGIYIYALETIGRIIERLEQEGIKTPLVDIGGGFPVPIEPGVPEIETFCEPINRALDKNLPAETRRICEPGRFIAATAVTLVTTVIGKSKRAGKMWYYLDDGIYGSFSGKLFDHARYLPIIDRNTGFKRSVLAGPTCDSIDVIFKEISLPQLEVGDLLIFPAMGAYCSVSSTSFNCLRKAEYFVID